MCCSLGHAHDLHEFPASIGSRSRASTGASAGSTVSRSLIVMYVTDGRPFITNPEGVRLQSPGLLCAAPDAHSNPGAACAE